jgi:methionyl aminopeptidase
MSLIKSAADIEVLRESGRRLATVLAALKLMAKPGVTGRELDAEARRLVAASGDKAAFLNYQPDGAPAPFPAALCVSINEEIVHGIPTDRVLKNGDVVSLDLGINHEGYFTDSAVTVAIGRVTPEAEALLANTAAALAAGIAKARAGNTLGDIGHAIEAVAKEHHYGVVRELGGHGVGHHVHEQPHIPNFGKQGTGQKLKAGMVLAIEPMFTLGTDDVDFMPDGYLVKTADGAVAAHFEHTVLITDGEAEILTKI